MCHFGGDRLGFNEEDLKRFDGRLRDLRHGARERPDRKREDPRCTRQLPNEREGDKRSRMKIRWSISCRRRPDPVNEKKGLTFARGLRSIFHDPDKSWSAKFASGDGSDRDPVCADRAFGSHDRPRPKRVDVIVDSPPWHRFLQLSGGADCVLARDSSGWSSLLPRPRPARAALALESGLDFEIQGLALYHGQGCHECNGRAIKAEMHHRILT